MTPVDELKTNTINKKESTLIIIDPTVEATNF